MNKGHDPKLHLGMTLQEAKKSTGIANGSPLPTATYGLVGKRGPSLLPKASAVAITWAERGLGATARYLGGQLYHALQRQVARQVDGPGGNIRAILSLTSSLTPKEKPLCPPF